MWLRTNELSRAEKLRRALYRSLRDELDYFFIDYALIESFQNFLSSDSPYPYIEKRELKPRAKVAEVENQLINSFIVIFSEESLPKELKKNIRFFDTNKTTRENLFSMNLSQDGWVSQFHKHQKFIGNEKFYDLLRKMLKFDYGLVIQQDSSIKTKIRYELSHFHVRIDWLLDAAAESLGKQLRYISKELYEKGEKSAEEMVMKLFEYYSFHHSVSGRRTAAMLAAQLLRNYSFLSTVFVSSAEARTLTKISQETITKYSLMRLSKNQIEQIEKHPSGVGLGEFRNNFLIHQEPDGSGTAIFQVVYVRNDHSNPPTDGKLREFNPDVQWLNVASQTLIPKPSNRLVRPIWYDTIYDQQDPLAKN
jgi:hypothetical protein